MKNMQTKLFFASLVLMFCEMAEVLFYGQLTQIKISIWFVIVLVSPSWFILFLTAFKGIPPIRLLRFGLFFATSWYALFALLDEIIYFSPHAEPIIPPGQHSTTTVLQISIFIGFFCYVLLIRAYTLLGGKRVTSHRFQSTYWMEWRGPPGSTPPEDVKGCYYNPGPGESYHPDVDHSYPIGPHWDFVAPDGTYSRIMSPDGAVVLKEKEH